VVSAKTATTAALRGALESAEAEIKDEAVGAAPTVDCQVTVIVRISSDRSVAFAVASKSDYVAEHVMPLAGVVHDGVVQPRLRDARGVPDGWVLLVFRLPREPSTPRIALWRKLRALGTVQLLDGLVALPLDSRNREQLEWLADGVLEAGGEATVWVGQPAASADERRLIERMSAAVAADYRALIEETLAVGTQTPGRQRRSLGRLRRELRRIRYRDYFTSHERDGAAQAIDQLATAVEEVVS
jgi:hypothetical protein